MRRAAHVKHENISYCFILLSTSRYDPSLPPALPSTIFLTFISTIVLCELSPERQTFQMLFYDTLSNLDVKLVPKIIKFLYNKFLLISILLVFFIAFLNTKI